jgi:transposase
MCPLRYYTMLLKSKDRTYLRFEMVRYAREHGIKACARHFSTTVKTVRKWLRRWQPGSLRGLQELSRAPLHPRQGITARARQQAITLKQQLPSWGAQRMKRDFSLSLSTKALCRIWRTEGLLKRKRRKHKTKQNLREVKRQWRLFEQTCLDTKDLKDIPELWPQIKQHRLPLVQYTAREVTSGWQFVAYAQERCLAYSKLFAEIILEHLRACGVRFKHSRFQTDNGNEFVGSWQAKADSEFTKAVESVRGLRHHTIPPRAHRWQSDVETVHRLIEDEFYEVEQFASRADFLAKARAYNLWFNVGRKNSYKENQTPWEIIKEREPQVSPALCALPPVFLDELFMKKLDSKLLWGYDLIPHPSLVELQRPVVRVRLEEESLWAIAV